MGVTLFRKTYYFVKRVPKRYHGLVLGPKGKPIQQVRRCLHTDSLTLAKQMAPAVEAQIMAEWEAIRDAANVPDTTTLDVAQRLARAHGFDYRPSAEIVSNPDEILRRLDALESAQPGGVTSRIILGTAKPKLPSLTVMLDEFFDLTKAQHARKSVAQIKKYQSKYRRSVDTFNKYCIEKQKGDFSSQPIDEISRDLALEFRNWWQDRIISQGLRYDTANRDFLHLSQIVKEWARLKCVVIDNPFLDLRIKGKDTSDRATFSRDWLVSKVFADGALLGLNPEARCVLQIMANTGARPSEITDTPVSDYVLDAEIPFLRIAPNGRELKVAHTQRELPLVGISLEAAKAIVANGGFARYAHKANSWSATANKYLRENGLMESPKHSAYSIRHYIEDALLAAGVDERVRADIMGHKTERPAYGEGGGLSMRLEAIKRIAI